MRTFDYIYVLKVALKWLQNQESAEDFAQEFYIWYMNKLPTYNPSTSTYRKWFIAHLVFQLKNYKYKHRNRDVFFDVTAVCNKTMEDIDGAIIRAAILKSSECLTPKQQNHVRLYLAGYTEDTEMAALLGVHRHTIIMSFRDIKPRLKKALIRSSAI